MNKNVKTSIFLYTILLISVLLQVGFNRYVVFFPDLILLMVVFVSIFRGSAEGARFGLVAGFLRGCFSPETFLVDILLFPIVGTISSLFPRWFYRHKPVSQVFITMIAILFVIVSHLIYINIISGNNVSVPLTIATCWETIAVTLVIAPVIFTMLRVILKVEE